MCSDDEKSGCWVRKEKLGRGSYGVEIIHTPSTTFGTASYYSLYDDNELTLKYHK